MLVIKIMVIGTLALMGYQDIKGRSIYVFLFPILGLCSGYLYYNSTTLEVFFINILLNCLWVTLLFLVVMIYSRVKLKVPWSNTMGAGDVLLFYVLGLSFSSMAFIAILTGAMGFALLSHLLIKKNGETVPLAGYMSLFVMFTYTLYWSGVLNNMYSF